MKLTNELKSLLDGEVKKAVKEVLDAKGLNRPSVVKEALTTSKNILTDTVRATGNALKEAIVMIPRAFLIKTEKLSDRTKEAHSLLYKEAIEAFNKLSIGLDAANTEESKATTSAFRSLKVDETFNLNSVKLHELYFTNISDLASEISVDSLPYMRLARDFGTFERWQYDFMACALAARNGWAITVFEPYRNVYMNILIDGHNEGIPLGTVPVIAMDMFEHAYFKDYANDKKAYLTSMMRELNWNVIEARMTVAEEAKLDSVFKIQPVTNGVPDAILGAAASQAGGQPPINDVQPAQGFKDQLPKGGHQGPLGPSTPPAPALTPGFDRAKG